MKKVCFYISLLLVNIAPMFFIFGLFYDIKTWEYCTLGSGYLFVFAICYFAEQTSTFLLECLIFISIYALVNFSMIFSYIKYTKIYLIPIIFCVLDIVVSMILGMYFVVVLDFILIVLIVLSKKCI